MTKVLDTKGEQKMDYWIDEVRIKSDIAYNKIKEFIANCLIKLAYNLCQEHLKKCSVGTKIEMDIVKYIPNDGKWRHIAMTMEYYIKLSKDFDLENKEEKILYIDGTKQII